VTSDLAQAIAEAIDNELPVTRAYDGNDLDRAADAVLAVLRDAPPEQLAEIGLTRYAILYDDEADRADTGEDKDG
jgi:hypothetical protein